jgi:hypothetical protein
MDDTQPSQVNNMIRGVVLEDEFYLYDWDEDRNQLVVRFSSIKKAEGKELFQALCKYVKSRKSLVTPLTPKQLAKALHSYNESKP